MATKAERNARLDALEAAAKAWGEQRKKELNLRVDTCKKILRGRTGSERLASSAVTSASSLVIDEIDDFLVTK